MKKEFSVFTDCELEFITKSCALLDVNFEIAEGSKPIKHSIIRVDGDNEQILMLAKLMEFNYKRNFNY